MVYIVIQWLCDYQLIYQMEESLFISEVVKKETELDTLNQQQLHTVLALFNLKRSHRQQQLQDLKKLIGGILLVQRNFYKEYLQMHKFKQLPQNLTIAISICFSSFWNLFQQMHSKTPQSNLNNSQIKLSEKIIKRYEQQSREVKIYQQQNEISRYKINVNSSVVKIQQDQICNMENAEINGKIKGDEDDDEYEQKKGCIEQKAEQGGVNFMNCVCKSQSIFVKYTQAMLTKDQPYYLCPNCNAGYHYNCLDLPTDNDSITFNNANRQKCPYCLITKSNLFIKIFNNQPIITGWLTANEQFNNRINKLFFEEYNMVVLKRAMEFMKENKGFRIQMRMLKISRKGKKVEKQDSNRFNRSGFVVNQMLLKRLVLRKWMEFQLKQIDQNCKVYYAMVCVGPRSKQSLIQKIISNKNIEKQKQYFKINTSVPITKQLQVYPYQFPLYSYKTRKMIQLPVRDQNCNHLNFFDLMDYYNDYLIHNAAVFKCYFCETYHTIASQFILDRQVYQTIHKILKKEGDEDGDGEDREDVYGDDKLYKLVYNDGGYEVKQMMRIDEGQQSIDMQ